MISITSGTENADGNLKKKKIDAEVLVLEELLDQEGEYLDARWIYT